MRCTDPVWRPGDPHNDMNIAIYIATSANGFISNARNVPDWLSPEYGRGFYETCRTKAVIMGRKTYDILAPDHLPLSEGSLVVVLTSHAGAATPNPSVVFTSARPHEIVSMLEGKGFSEAVIVGGTVTMSQFIDAGLVNDIILVVEPVLFGGEALPLLRGVAHDHKLHLIDSAKLNDDTIRLHYRVAARSRSHST